MATIKFESPRKVTIALSKTIAERVIPQRAVPPQTMEDVSTVDIIEAIDNRIDKTVIASVSINNSNRRIDIIVWSGADYDVVGQWTDEQLNERVNQILTQ